MDHSLSDFVESFCDMNFILKLSLQWNIRIQLTYGSYDVINIATKMKSFSISFHPIYLIPIKEHLQRAKVQCY